MDPSLKMGGFSNSKVEILRYVGSSSVSVIVISKLVPMEAESWWPDGLVVKGSLLTNRLA